MTALDTSLPDRDDEAVRKQFQELGVQTSRRAARSSLLRWLEQMYDTLGPNHGRIHDWQPACEAAVAAGVRGGNGQLPTPRLLASQWRKIKRRRAAVALRAGPAGAPMTAVSLAIAPPAGSVLALSPILPGSQQDRAGGGGTGAGHAVGAEAATWKQEHSTLAPAQTGRTAGMNKAVHLREDVDQMQALAVRGKQTDAPPARSKEEVDELIAVQSGFMEVSYMKRNHFYREARALEDDLRARAAALGLPPRRRICEPRDDS